MSLRTAAALTAAIAASYPNAKLGSTVTGLQASGESVHNLQAVGVKDFSSLGKLQYVRANENFFAQGSHIFVGDIVQLPEDDAKMLLRSGRVSAVTDEEVAEAKASAPAETKAGK